MGGGGFTIRLRVQLRHPRRPVAEHDAGRLDADLASQLRGRRVSQLMRVPVLDVGPLAGPADGMAQAARRVPLARQAAIQSPPAAFPGIGGPLVSSGAGPVGIGPAGGLGRLANRRRRLPRLE